MDSDWIRDRAKGSTNRFKSSNSPIETQQAMYPTAAPHSVRDNCSNHHDFFKV